MRRSTVYTLLALLLAAPLTQLAFSQQVASIGINVEKSELGLKVFPDGSIKLLYHLRGVVKLPQDVLRGANLDITIQGNSSYRENSSSRTLSVSGTINSASLNTSAKLHIDMKARMSQQGQGVSASLNGKVFFANETSMVEIDVLDASIKAANSSKALFSLDVAVKGLQPGKTRGVKTLSVDEVNKMLEEKGLGYIKLESLGVILEKGNRTRFIARGVVDIDKMLEAAVNSGMPASDAEKLKKLLEERVNIVSEADLVVKLEAKKGKGVTFLISYQDKTSGELEKAEKLQKEASPLLTELVTALLRKTAMETGNEKLLQLLLLGSMSSTTRQSSLPIEAIAPSRSAIAVHVYSSKDGIVIEVDYEGPRQRITPSSGDPSVDAERTLTLISSQLVQLRSQLSRLGLLVHGAEELIPGEARIIPATGSVEVSKTTAPLSELPAVKIEIAGTATTPAPPTTPTTSKPASTTTKTATPGAGKTTATSSTETRPGSTTISTGKTSGRGHPSSVVIGSIVFAVAVVAAAIIIARRR